MSTASRQEGGGPDRPRAGSGAAPLLAALLARALPSLAVLDLGAGLYPCLPGALLGVPEAAALPAPEAALLRRFRQAGGTRPLFGFDAAADAALLAGAPLAWGGAAERLVGLPAAPPSSLAPLLRSGPPEPLLLLPGEVADVQGPEQGRIILLLGAAGRIGGWTLLLPPDRTAPVFEALRAAAATLPGVGAQPGGRMLSPRMASLALLTEDPAGFTPALSLPAEALAHDGALPALGGRLPLGGDAAGESGAGRAVLRLLLGLLPARPWTLRLRLHAGRPDPVPPVLFLDGRRHPAGVAAEPGGALTLEAGITPAPGQRTVLGLALPPGAEPGSLALAGLELLA